VRLPDDDWRLTVEATSTEPASVTVPVALSPLVMVDGTTGS
jgi:hypothetical protein